jgi:co-chaperonin GroES (HSP10)
MLYPVNNHVVVCPCEEEEEKSTVLLPEDVQVNINPYSVVEVVQPCPGSVYSKGMRLVVRTHMIEQVVFNGETHYLLTENNIMGFLGESE